MRENSAKITFLLIFAIILYIYPLYAIAATFLHKEKDYGPTEIPKIDDIQVYNDGTVVASIIRNKTNTTAIDTFCFYEKFFLSLTEQKNQILVIYYNETNVDTYEEWGMIIDFDGTEFDRTSFGSAVFGTTKVIMPIDSVQLNINREKGFIRYGFNFRNSTNLNTSLAWKQYRVELNGTFTKLTNGKLDVSDLADLVTVIPTVDEGYAIVYTKKMNDFNAAEPFLPQNGLFVSFIEYNQMSVPPLLLYHTFLPNVEFSGLSCANLFIGAGQVCTLTIVQKISLDIFPLEKIFYVKINFLSSGSVTDLTVIDRITPNIPTNIPNVNLNRTWEVNSLPFGGYLLTNFIFENQTIFGYLFNESDVNPIQWDLNEPESTNGMFVILPQNNTLLVGRPETNNSWGFQVIDLPKFAGDRDKGYSNLNVEATSPKINNNFTSLNTLNISIDFYESVELSDGSLSIYQVVDDKQYLRQTIPSTSCSTKNDDKTVIADVLESTFSVSNGSYFIKMDNNFVKDKAHKEPLLGIRENVWSFTTEEKSNTSSPSTTGLLRLTSNGTQLFGSLSREERNNFFGTLLNELSAAVPVDSSRLDTNRMAKLDNEKQYLISIIIKAGNDNNVKSVVSIIDTMVKNKYQTSIGSGNKTRYLDESYGFVQSPDLWKKRLSAFSIIGFFAILFFILFLFARKRDKYGNNIVILQLGMIIFDLVMDILFASNNARVFPELFIPSVVFVTIPVGINMILTSYIIKKEYKRPKFHQWFIAQKKLAYGFTILSGADIIALNTLHSNLAGFSFLRAPFSDSAKSKIFWGACLNIFTEHIPQVIIQIVYRYKVGPIYYDNYDFIPLFTLISSAVNLAINIIGRLRQAKHHMKRRNGSTNDTDDSHTVVHLSTSDDNKQDLQDLEKLDACHDYLHGENTLREIESASQNYSRN